MNQTYLRIGLGVAIALQVASFLGYIVALAAIVTGVILVAALVAGVAKVKLCEAHIYKHLENGTLQYCDAKQATHTNFQYLGTAKVDCKKVGRCSFS